PENYVDPTVRLGQSGMMNTMLQTLGQAQLNTDTVGDAFNTYLNSFEEVANLRVISGYHDHLDVHEGKTYFIGTNQSEVREFYWRSADEGRRGEDGQLAANASTDWRKIECAAQPWGDCIRPVIYKSRLYLCWLERKDVTPPNTYRALDNAGVFEYAINISYLRYDGNWTSPKMVDVTDELSRFDLENTSLGLYCSNFQKDEAMTVLVYTKIPATSASEEAPDKSLLYVYEDMSTNYKAYADAVTFAEYIRHQLDSESATFVVNVYAQALDVDKKLSFFSEQVNDFKMVGDASNITGQDGSSNSGIVLSLSPRFSVENRLAGWKHRVYREIVLANGGGFVFFHGVHFVLGYDFHVFRGANFIYLVFPLQYDVQYGSLKEAKAYDVVSDTYVSLGVGTRSEASNDGYVIYK
ncbi:hypothetical protein DNF23_53415, partial [Pseudomonas syringae pv. pisi]